MEPMGLGLDKPATPLTADAVAALPAQLGVYELVDDAGATTRIGYAGGLTPFGLRSALGDHLDDPVATGFRVEITHAYLTRSQELLMVHLARHGSLPPDNRDGHEATTIGTLSPGGTN